MNIRMAALSLTAVLLATAVKGETFSPPLLHAPTISDSQIVFVYADELWTVSRQGGAAHLLTSGPGVKSSPALSPARFAHTGTGTVRMCFPLPIRSAITQCSSRTWRSSILSSTSSARRSPHPMSSARIARLRLPRRLPDGGSPSKVLD
jgi:hypothetical protein